LKDENQVEEFAKNFGLDNKERKLLGLSKVEFDKTKMKENKQNSLF